MAKSAVSLIKGGWGRQGWTRTYHPRADQALLQSLLLTAWRNVTPKSLQKGAG